MAGGLQVLMFSATLHSEEVRSVAAKICQNPILVDLKVRPSIDAQASQIRPHPWHNALQTCELAGKQEATSDCRTLVQAAHHVAFFT